MEQLTGKAAVVTGGSRGIGFAIARALLDRGASVMITGTSEKRLADASRELAAAARGGSVTTQPADVRKYDEVERMMNAAASRFGGIDVLVNNAGVGLFTRGSEMSVGQWHDIIDNNLTGVFYCCHAALPHLRNRGGGWIININSLAGTNPVPDGAAYCASKAGLNAFSESLMQ